MFSEKDIIDNIDNAYVQRGRSYQKQEKVRNLAWDASGQQLTAMVEGTHDQLYQVNIFINEEGEERFIIYGDCTCPVGYNCKHVAATLFQALADEVEQYKTEDVAANLLPTELESWIRTIAKSQDPAPDKTKLPQDTQEHLLYLLNIERTAQSQCLQVQLQTARLLKSGEYGKTYAFSFDNYPQKPFLSDIDREICGLIDVGVKLCELTRHVDSFTLEGERGEAILMQMLQTKRCLWASKDGETLSGGDPRDGELTWEASQQGEQNLACNIGGSNAVVAPVNRLWYFDLSENVSGLVNTNIDSLTAAALYNCPTIRPEQAQSVRQALGEFFGEQTGLLPKIYHKKRKIYNQPKPCLRLFGKELRLSGRTYWDPSPRYTQRLPLAEVTYLYGTQEIPAQERQRVLSFLVDDQLIEIQRDLAAETQLRDSLVEFDIFAVNQSYQLHPSEVNGEHYLLAGDSAQDPLSTVRIVREVIPLLEEKGWQIEQDDSFPFYVVDDKAWYADVYSETGTEWFDLELGIELNGKKINLLPLLVNFLQEELRKLSLADMKSLADHEILLNTPDGTRIPISGQRLLSIINTLSELHDSSSLNSNKRLSLANVRATQLTHLDEEFPVHWYGGDKIREIGAQLVNFTGIKKVRIPNNFQATLREYQQIGVNWMQFLRQYQLAGILADDMGLGKTVQALAHLAVEKQAKRLDKPCLVISPTSLVFNWRDETNRFAPFLDIVCWHGPQRSKNIKEFLKAEVIITTYPLIVRDDELFSQRDYHYLILDEAQIIKNPKAKATQVLLKLKARHRLCLTGTPMENHLGELWSLFHFLMPGLLGSQRQFKSVFRNPIEKNQDTMRQQALARRIAPFLLRRRKDDVIKELPPKTIMIRGCELNGEQRDLYETIRLSMQQKVNAAIAEHGFARSQIIILDALLKLRQTCCDPRLLSIDSAKDVDESAKLELLMSLIPNLIKEGRRILLFSSFTKMLGLIEKAVKVHKIKYVKLTGQTRDRETPIKRFQNEEVPLFLISLKAGGVGLNLTAADTVIHYDPWWNPAAEAQATDRAHRIGQEKPVFVYKLITHGSVEEKILELQKKKQSLLEGIYQQRESNQVSLTAEDLAVLFEPLAEVE